MCRSTQLYRDEFGFEIFVEDYFKSKGWLQYNERIQKNTK